MKRITITAVLAAGLALGSWAGYAKLPPAPPMSDAEKAAKAEKDAAAKAKDAAALAQAEERAVANYRKNKGIAEPKAAVPAKGMKTQKK